MSETQPSRPGQGSKSSSCRRPRSAWLRCTPRTAGQREADGRPVHLFRSDGTRRVSHRHGLDVRPHPHIGLATVTYLLDGAILHRDSLGTQLPIVPGEVNWMTAGRGIAHSERTDAELGARQQPVRDPVLGGAAEADGGDAPAFAHHAAEPLPVLADGGVRLRLIAGNAWGLLSPVETFWALFFADATWRPGAVLPLPDQHEEREVYVVQGSMDVAGSRSGRGRCCCSAPATALRARGTARGSAVAIGWSSDGRAAPHLLEFRLVLAGADLTGQGRLEGRPFRRGRGGRDRVYPDTGGLMAGRMVKKRQTDRARRSFRPYLSMLLWCVSTIWGPTGSISTGCGTTVSGCPFTGA